jgi:hypothetical protein
VSRMAGTGTLGIFGLNLPTHLVWKCPNGTVLEHIRGLGLPLLVRDCRGHGIEIAKEPTSPKFRIRKCRWRVPRATTTTHVVRVQSTPQSEPYPSVGGVCVHNEPSPLDWSQGQGVVVRRLRKSV